MSWIFCIDCLLIHSFPIQNIKISPFCLSLQTNSHIQKQTMLFRIYIRFFANVFAGREPPEPDRFPIEISFCFNPFFCCVLMKASLCMFSAPLIFTYFARRWFNPSKYHPQHQFYIGRLFMHLHHNSLKVCCRGPGG